MRYLTFLTISELSCQIRTGFSRRSGSGSWLAPFYLTTMLIFSSNKFALVLWLSLLNMTNCPQERGN